MKPILLELEVARTHGVAVEPRSTQNPHDRLHRTPVTRHPNIWFHNNQRSESSHAFPFFSRTTTIAVVNIYKIVCGFVLAG